MRLFTVSILLISFAFIPQSVFSATAKTIDELVAPYNVEGCVDCHEMIHDEWKNSWHGKSIVDSRVLRTWRTFILGGLDKSEPAKRKDLRDVCLPCHAPMAVSASDELAAQIADLIVTAVESGDKSKSENAKKELSKLNINCLVCHGTKELPRGKHEPGVIYGPKGEQDPEEAAHEEFKTVKYDFIQTSEFCAQCHHGCPPDMPSSVCPTLFTSYKEKYLAGGGTETCQGCHMKPADPEDPKSHKFPGIYDADYAATGIELTLEATPTTYVYHLENRFVPAVVVEVKAKNTAGHGIPHG